MLAAYSCYTCVSVERRNEDIFEVKMGYYFDNDQLVASAIDNDRCETLVQYAYITSCKSVWRCSAEMQVSSQKLDVGGLISQVEQDIARDSRLEILPSQRYVAIRPITRSQKERYWQARGSDRHHKLLKKDFPSSDWYCLLHFRPGLSVCGEE